jgi:LysM repeat protein
MRHSLLLAICLILFSGSFADAGENKTYVIKKGDTPGAVAKRFHVPLDELLRYNNLSKNSSFKIGVKLQIPNKGEVTGNKYVVKPGDSVAKVSDFHGVSQDDLRAANAMGKNDKLQLHEEIVIPMVLRGSASRSHVVRKGDTLSKIAKKYGIKVKHLTVANKIGKKQRLKLGRVLIIPDKEDTPGIYRPKKSSKLVKSGVKIPGGVRHTVQPGQSLWMIARAYNVKGVRIAKRNGISTDTPLSIGKKLIVPGAKEVVPVRVKGFTIQPVRFVRVWNSDTIKVRLMTRSGKINQNSRRRLSKLSGPRRSRRNKLLHPRLIHMIQRVAERWPGKTIEIVSGYRPGQKGTESQHSNGRAIDFRVLGISNKELYNFCAELPKSGCGYYPNSVFIHMDARKKSATWTDLSAPGKPSRYVKKGAKKKPAQPQTETETQTPTD